MDNNNDKLFFKIWRNLYLNNQIIKHLKLYVQNNNIIIDSNNKLINHKYKGYVTTLSYESNIPISLEELMVLRQSFTSLKELTLTDINYNSLVNGVLPNSLISLRLIKYNHQLNQNVIPDSVVSLCLDEFNQPLELISFPVSLTSLNLKSFIRLINPGALPNSLKELYLSSYYHPLIKGCIPNSVEFLNLDSFDQVLPNDECAIPNSVLTLNLAKFNKQLYSNCLPSSVTDLSLNKYNQPLSIGSIPNSVTKLRMNCYSLPISSNDILPNSIKYLYLNNFKNKLDNLPTSIELLSLNKYGPLKLNTIPKNINHLILKEFKYNIVAGTLPNSLKILQINSTTFQFNNNNNKNNNYDNNPINFEYIYYQDYSY